MDQLRLRARTLRNDSTDAERHLWMRLRLNQLAGFKFRRQMPISGYVADFVCTKAKLIVELDGGQHAQQRDYDAQRTIALEAKGYRVIGYWNDDVLLRTEDVLEDLLRALMGGVEIKVKVKGTPPQPSPSLREREGANSNNQSDSNCESEGNSNRKNNGDGNRPDPSIGHDNKAQCS